MASARHTVPVGRADIPASAAAANEWTTYGGNLYNQRYSALKQVTVANVSQLKAAWTFHTGLFNDKTSFESSPVVVGDTMYVTGPHSEVFALDATTGAKDWEYQPSYARRIAKLPLCCGQVNRGVAVGDGMVFVAQLNGQLVALDAQTGAVKWSVHVGPSGADYSETAAPLFFDGRIFIGVSGAEYPIRGFMNAYDATSGKLLWRFYTIPAPGQTGHNTWPASDAWKTGGGSVWDTPALDPHLGLIYFGVGNPNPDLDGHPRPGNNLFTDSIVALHLGDGSLAWYYQEVHHDTWDYDATSPPVLFDTDIDGRSVPGIGEAGKSGWLYLLNRETGKPIHPIPEVPVDVNAWQRSSPTQPEPVGTAFVPHHCSFRGFPQHATFGALAKNTPTVMCPGNSGGSEWSPTSYNPMTGDQYVCAINEPMIFVGNPATSPPPGEERWGSTLAPTVVGSYTGSVVAISVAKGSVAWTHDLPLPCIGGTMTTAGGLVFVGRSDGEFLALDAATGKTLWSFQTGAGANAPAVTYEEHGVQYVAIAAGGSKSQSTPKGDGLWVFSLHGTTGPAPAPPVQVPQVYTSSIQLTARGLTPSDAAVGICTTVSITNDTALPARIQIGERGRAAALSPGATLHTTLRAIGATLIRAETPQANSTADVIVASELPKGSGCT